MTTTRPMLTVERIAEKLAELGEKGKKAVCLTCDGPENRTLKDFAHDNSNQIGELARAAFPFFGATEGCFSLGMRGYFYTPEAMLPNFWPAPEECIDFPLSEV